MKLILAILSLSLGACVAYTPAYYSRPQYVSPYQPTPCYTRYPHPYYYNSSPTVAIQYRVAWHN